MAEGPATAWLWPEPVPELRGERVLLRGWRASDLDLFEPLDTGVWITIDVDTVRSIYQQYRP